MPSNYRNLPFAGCGNVLIFAPEIRKKPGFGNRCTTTKIRKGNYYEDHV